MRDPDPVELHRTLEYDPVAGTLRRRRDGGDAVVGRGRGRGTVSIGGRRRSAARVAWAMATGRWPDVGERVVATSGDPSDLRLESLELCWRTRRRTTMSVDGPATAARERAVVEAQRREALGQGPAAG